MNLSNREYLEKRDFIRMRIDSPVEMLVVGEVEPVTGTCHNLSGGGMLIEVDAALPPAGTEVEITLTSSHGRAPMLRATATVARIDSESIIDGTAGHLGLRLKDILV